MRDPKCDSKNNSLLPSDLSLRAHVVDAGELDDWDCRDTGTDRASEPSHLMSRTNRHRKDFEWLFEMETIKLMLRLIWE